jgi:hypothetical protein
MESKKCIECGKPLRKCKRVDIEDREIHYSCIEKNRKKKWEEDYEKLKEFLASKNIILR